jgi:hypothetical protein
MCTPQSRQTTTRKAAARRAVLVRNKELGAHTFPRVLPTLGDHERLAVSSLAPRRAPSRLWRVRTTPITERRGG